MTPTTTTTTTTNTTTTARLRQGAHVRVLGRALADGRRQAALARRRELALPARPRRAPRVRDARVRQPADEPAAAAAAARLELQPVARDSSRPVQGRWTPSTLELHTREGALSGFSLARVKARVGHHTCMRF